MRYIQSLPIAASLVGLLFNTPQVLATDHDGCRCMPEDDCWPSQGAWENLNSTVAGRLIATVPIGSPCHDPTYDEAACALLREEWTNPLLHIPDSSSIMATYFTNRSCDPFSDRSTPCELGNYVSYAVAVRHAADISETVKFANEHNIRLVIKNTGHDFQGRSTGAGGLSVWVQDLKDFSISTWSDDIYEGPAITVGPGVLGFELLEEAHLNNVSVVSGECATVALGGGFIQGGGHSALSSTFGMAADQTLSFEVVTANGDIVTASPSENEDLYWALSGGGGGNYGIVSSVTVRAHPNRPVAGGEFLFVKSMLGDDVFEDVVTAFHSHLPRMVDAGGMFVYLFQGELFMVSTITVWDSSAEQLENEIMAPYFEELAELGVQVDANFTTLSYRDHYERYMGPLPEGQLHIGDYASGGRMMPRAALEEDPRTFSKALIEFADEGAQVIVSSADYSHRYDVDNAVNPAWRDTIAQVSTLLFFNNTGPWEDVEAVQDQMSDDMTPRLTEVTPGGSAYGNEADYRQENWEEAFYGDSYERLLEVKRKWDPESLFYAYHGVGSQAWTVGEDERLCRAQCWHRS